LGVRSRIVELMLTALAAAAVAQITTRISKGSATPHRTIAQNAFSQAIHNQTVRVDGARSIRLQERAAQRGVAGVFGHIARDEISHKVRIRQFEKFSECGTFAACALDQVLTQVTQQQQIQLLHAAATAPLEPA
jgi:hypothetical protein